MQYYILALILFLLSVTTRADDRYTFQKVPSGGGFPVAVSLTATPDRLIGFDGDGALALLPAPSSAWGSITGSLEDQADLWSALDAKQDTLTAGTGVSLASNTVSIGQSVATTATPQFAGLHVKGGATVDQINWGDGTKALHLYGRGSSAASGSTIDIETTGTTAHRIATNSNRGNLSMYFEAIGGQSASSMYVRGVSGGRVEAVQGVSSAIRSAAIYTDATSTEARLALNSGGDFIVAKSSTAGRINAGGVPLTITATALTLDAGSSGTITVNLASLPTDPTGLPVGTLYRDGGAIKVVEP